MTTRCLCRTMALTLVFTSLAAAARAGSPEQPPQISAREGPWALLFQVKGNLTLAPFQGSMISVQRDLHQARAVRLGVGGLGTSTNGSAGGETVDETNVSVSAIYLRYASRDRDVNLFFGAGPDVGFASVSRARSSSSTEDTEPEYYEWKSEEHNWHVGLRAILGAEWRLTPHIALTAEYATSAAYTSTELHKTTRVRVGDGDWHTSYEEHPEAAGWKFGDLQVRLGLTIYL